MSQKLTRRDALKSTAAIGAGLWLGTSTVRAEGPNEKLNIACIGIGGRGGANLGGVSSQNIVALCDVDDKRAGKAYEKHRKARKFYDYRKMFDAMETKIDAVVVSTPDHSHFHPSMMAMNRGKHLYCEKPMARTIWETREMTKLAAKKKIATQLGVQRHTLSNVHKVVELVQSGAIGQVSEVHCWIDGSRGMPKIPKDTPQVPDGLKWDLWVGPGKMRPYHPTICPYGWRFWWDYGTGETGNWGCHILDIPFWALNLKYPTRVDAEKGAVDPLRTPKSMSTRFRYPAAGGRPEVRLHWYHAAGGPPVLRKHKLSAKGNNTLFIGSHGMLLCGFGKHQLIPTSNASVKTTAVKLPKSPGFYREWINACKGGKPATCHFGYSGPLAETVLLGNVAFRAGGGFDWDAAALKAGGRRGVEQYLRPTFRKGWET